MAGQSYWPVGKWAIYLSISFLKDRLDSLLGRVDRVLVLEPVLPTPLIVIPLGSEILLSSSFIGLHKVHLAPCDKQSLSH